MLGVIVVDDEVLVRVGLRTTTPWESLGCRFLGDAANGADGLRLVEELEPDIVITDVKMPVMDGLEMIRRSRAAKHRSRFIILSSYDEFPLVREAMRLGAEDYLIKLELDEAGLGRVIRAVGGKITAEAEESRQRQAQGAHDQATREAATKELLSRLIDGAFGSPGEIAAAAARLGIDASAGRVACGLIRVDDVAHREKYAGPQDRAVLEANLEGLVAEMASDLLSSHVLRRGERVFVLAALFDDGVAADKAIAMLQESGARSLAALRTYVNATATAGISNLHEGLAGLAGAFAEALAASEHSFFLGPGQVILYRDVRARHARGGGIDAAAHLKEMQDALEYCDEQRVGRAFDAARASLERPDVGREQAYDFCCQIAYKLREIAAAEGAPWLRGVLEGIGLQSDIIARKTLAGLLDWLEAVRRGSVEALRAGKSPHALMISKAKKYVRDHLSQEVTLGAVAQMLGVNHCHLSTLFKQETGQGFAEHVARARIAEACRLLATGRYRVYEVADMLGYGSPYYFSRVFKKVTAATPREFVERSAGRAQERSMP